MKWLYKRLLYEAQFSDPRKVPTWWILGITSLTIFVIGSYYQNIVSLYISVIPIAIYLVFAFYAIIKVDHKDQ